MTPPASVNCPTHGERSIDLGGLDPMCPDCRAVSPDGKPLGWQDGRPTEFGQSDPYTRAILHLQEDVDALADERDELRRELDRHQRDCRCERRALR